MKRDTVVGLVGALILLVALVGVFRYESANVAGGPSYALAAPRALASFDGNAAVGQAYSAPVAVSAPNLTRMEFVLDASGGGTFNLSVKAPDGQVRAVSGAGPLRVSFPVAPTPGNGTTPPTPQGQGNWTVTVTLTQAPAGGPVPATVPVVGQNGSVPFRVTPYVTEFESR